MSTYVVFLTNNIYQKYYNFYVKKLCNLCVKRR